MAMNNSIFDKKNKKGFTLLELLVMISIIGLLATFAVVAVQNARIKARDSRRLHDVKQITKALEMYNDEFKEYPCENIDPAHMCIIFFGGEAKPGTSYGSGAAELWYDGEGSWSDECFDDNECIYRQDIVYNLKKYLPLMPADPLHAFDDDYNFMYFGPCHEQNSYCRDENINKVIPPCYTPLIGDMAYAVHFVTEKETEMGPAGDKLYNENGCFELIGCAEGDIVCSVN